jgi:hypothetical protein
VAVVVTEGVYWGLRLVLAVVVYVLLDQQQKLTQLVAQVHLLQATFLFIDLQGVDLLHFK